MSAEIKEILEEIDTKGKGLTDWELKFVADILERKQETFSTKQENMIRKILEERVP